MAKSELTKTIENKLYSYDPENFSGYKINKFRKTLMATEVPVTNSSILNGIIDFVRLDEYENIIRTYKACDAFYEWSNNSIKKYCTKGFTNYKECNPNGNRESSPRECDNELCINCREFIEKEYLPLFSCFEIKITREDFKSECGHNFVGNLNYYVMPLKLFKEIKEKIPDDIGVITFNIESANSIRQTKAAKFRVLTDKENFNLLFSLAKSEKRRGYIHNKFEELEDIVKSLKNII